MKCVQCKKEIVIRGRAKKFCSHKCKNAYHYESAAKIIVHGNKDVIQEHIKNILDNRKVLKELYERGIKSTTYADLVMSGVHPFYFSKRSSVDGMITYYCFEYYFFRYGESNAVEIGHLEADMPS